MSGEVEYNRITFAVGEPQLRALWHEAFGDRDEYIDEFFEAFDADSVLHTLSHDGKLLSVLYALPYELHTGGHCKKVAYIYAVATVSSARGRGYMSRLFSIVHENLRREGFAAAFLLPAEDWLWNYYSRLGYKVCSWRCCECVATESMLEVCDVECCHTIATDVLAYVREQMLLGVDNIVHSDASIRLNVANCVLSGGGLYVARSANSVVGVAFVVFMNSVPLIACILGNDDNARVSLLSAIGRCYGCSSLHLLQSSDASGAPMAMLLSFDKTMPERINMQLMLDV